MNAPVLAITAGDNGGIGPEIIIRTLSQISSFSFIPVIYGSRQVFEHASLRSVFEALGCKESDNYQLGSIYFKHIDDVSDWVIGAPDSSNGEMSCRYLDYAVEDALSGVVQGLVTAPICKESWVLAGKKDTGHTTLLKRLTGVSDVSMSFVTPTLKTVMVTVHVPLSKVGDYLDEANLSRAIKHAHLLGQQCGISDPKIAVAGLNPHAGEGGLFGSEERDIIQPVIEKMKASVNVSGPYSADTLYYRAYQGAFDVVVSLYHDQGLIPIKLVHFHDAVNVTLGLPFVRTSPDHGTAFDIAYQNKATLTSFKAALNLANTYLG